jgi:hypothetical protein
MEHAVTLELCMLMFMARIYVPVRSWYCMLPISCLHASSTHQNYTHMAAVELMGVFVTREHVRHNKSGITHRGKTRISH